MIERAKIVTAAVAYDDPNEGLPKLFIIHQAIHIPEMDLNLPCPNQLRMNGIVINDCPKSMSDDPKNDRIH